MARLLVATDLSSLAQRGIAERLAARARADGHEASVVVDAPLAACRDADAVVALVDGSDPGGMPIAVAATAHALGLPTLALHTHALPDTIASLFTQAQAVTREEDLADALPGFYARVRPFAGKLVRDQVPRLVREAGHQVQFREAAPDERARYLKRKVADEAQELLEADPGQEREEVADLLEALETLLRVRGYDRDDLKLVKEAKRKRRGGFERFLVVESASTVTGTPAEPTSPSWPTEEPRLIRPRTAPTEYAPPGPIPDLGPEPDPAREREPELPPLPQPDVPAVESPGAEFQMPPAFLDATPDLATAERAPEPEAGVPAWLSEPAGAAAALTQAQAFSDSPAPATRTYEAPPPVFQPPAIPSFRIQQPPPVQPHNRTRLWNVGAKGEKEDVPEVYDDPDRIDPHVRDV